MTNPWLILLELQKTNGTVWDHMPTWTSVLCLTAESSKRLRSRIKTRHAPYKWCFPRLFSQMPANCSLLRLGWRHWYKYTGTANGVSSSGKGCKHEKSSPSSVKSFRETRGEWFCKEGNVTWWQDQETEITYRLRKRQPWVMRRSKGLTFSLSAALPSLPVKKKDKTSRAGWMFAG